MARLQWLNSLARGRSGFNFKSAIFNLVLLIGIFRASYDNALRWMSWDLPENKSTLVQIIAWCRQARSHYLSQCWPRSVSPYGVTRAQWVNRVVGAVCLQNLRSTYSLMATELRKMEEDMGPGPGKATTTTQDPIRVFEELLGHLCGQLYEFMTARIKMMDLYPEGMGLGGFLRWASSTHEKITTLSALGWAVFNSAPERFKLNYR